MVDLLRLWPVLLIAIGLELIVSRSKIQFLGYLSTLLIIAAFVWAVKVNGGVGVEGISFLSDIDRTEARLERKTEDAAELDVTFRDGRIRLLADEGNIVKVSSRGGRHGVKLNSDCTDHSCRVELRQTERKYLRILKKMRDEQDYWRCTLHPEVKYAANFELRDADLRLFAEELRIESFNVEAAHSDLVLKFGTNQSFVTVELEGRNNKVELHFPDSVGVRLKGVELTQEQIESLALTEEGGYLINSFYNSAPVNFSVTASLEDSRVRLQIYNP